MSEFDFDSEVTKAHLEAAGWQIGEFLHGNPFLCHVFYVCDYRTNHVELFSITMEDFDALKPMEPGELSALLLRLIKRHQRGRLTKKEGRALLPTLATYFKGTQVYRRWRDEATTNQRLHAVVNLYPGEGGWVRPFIAGKSATVISADSIQELSDGVRRMDLERHPEWFAG